MRILKNIHLSEREQEVLKKISNGMTVKEIANQLFLSPHTIVTYRKSLLRKLDARNGAGLVRKAIENGYLVIPERARVAFG